MHSERHGGIELLLTGDELLSGSIADANGSWLAERIFSLGGWVRRITIVGDDFDDLRKALSAAAQRASLVVVSGGLGPTLDDRSVDAACAAFDRQPIVVPEELARLEERFRRRGRALTPNNERQARIPSGAEALGNDFGAATAFVVRTDAPPCELWFLPGVPSEFRGIVEQKLLPRVASLAAKRGRHRCVRVIPTFGMPESHVDHRIAPLLADHPEVAYGIQNRLLENRVRLMVEAESAEDAERLCNERAEAIRAALGDAVFGDGEVSLPEVTLAALTERGLEVCFAESLTAGWAASLFASAPGASEALLGSFVTYSDAMKERLLGVSPEILRKEGAVSASCAQAMAEGALQRSGADVAVSLTGWAGPSGGNEKDPPGTIYAGVATPRGSTALRRVVPYGRQGIRHAAAHWALDLVRRSALGLPLGQE